MTKEKVSEVPEGAAVFPSIPAELEVNGLLLALLHAIVFISGSERKIVDPAAAEEALQYMAGYLQRLARRDLERLRLEMETLLAYARLEKWPRAEMQFLKDFVSEYGIGKGC
jgi:hypothetical protein